MKKILILVSKYNKKNKYIRLYLKKKMEGVEIECVEVAKLFFELKNNKLEIYIDGFSKKLSDFNFVYFRGIHVKHYSIVGCVALYLHYKNINYADKVYLDLGPSGNKFTALIKLSFSGLPVISSVFCHGLVVERNISNIVKLLSLPIVAKELTMQHGKGIKTLRILSDFARLGKNQFLFQKHIIIEKEYRFLVMGDKVRSIQKMYRDTSKFNLVIDMKKEEEFLPLGDFTEEMKFIAIKAAKILNLQVAGVDLAIEKHTGKIFIFEVNRGPGFTYDINISPEIPMLADYLNEKI